MAALLGSASVGGGTPMIETVQHLAATGEIERIRGVVNATTTYILSAMGDGRSYDEALREAQEAGYAEADPSFDVDGRDAAQKLAILASVAWGTWRPEADVKAEGIVGLKVEPGRDDSPRGGGHAGRHVCRARGHRRNRPWHAPPGSRTSSKSRCAMRASSGYRGRAPAAVPPAERSTPTLRAW